MKLDPLKNLFSYEDFLNRTFSLIGNPNWLGAVIILNLPILFYLYKKTENKTFYIISIFLNLIVLITTASKSAILALIIITILFLYAEIINKKETQISFIKNIFKNTKNILLIIFISGTLIALTLIIFTQRYSNTFELGRSTNSRRIIWNQSIEIIKSNPIGYGLETLKMIYPQFNTPKLWEFESITSRIDRAHNQILDMLITIGPIGTLIFYAFIFLIIKKNYKKENELKFYISLSLIGYLITNLFGFETIVPGVLFWIGIGILTKETKFTNKEKANFKITTIYTFTASILIIIAYFNSQHLLANIDFSKGENFIKQGNYYNGLQKFSSAISKFPYDRTYLLQASEVILASTRKNAENQKLLNQAQQYLNQAKKISNNQDPEVPILEAWLAAIQNNQNLFQAKLEEAKTINPYSVITYKIAIQIYRYLGQEEKAYLEWQNLLKLLPYFWNDPNNDPGRIFQKNNQWVLKLKESFK
jgi:hypothetical protein